jgi:hypothetical protein
MNQYGLTPNVADLKDVFGHSPVTEGKPHKIQKKR